MAGRSHLLPGIPAARKLEDSVSLQPFPCVTFRCPRPCNFQSHSAQEPTEEQGGQRAQLLWKTSPHAAHAGGCPSAEEGPVPRCRGAWCGHRNERTAISQAVWEAAVQNPKNQTKRIQANKKTLLRLQPGTQDSKQKRLESQYILPWGNWLCLSQRGEKCI